MNFTKGKATTSHPLSTTSICVRLQCQTIKEMLRYLSRGSKQRIEAATAATDGDVILAVMMRVITANAGGEKPIKLIDMLCSPAH